MFRTILVPVDLNQPSSWEETVPLAKHLAQGKAAIHIVSVLPDFGMPVVGSYFPKDFERKALDESKERLQALAKSWKLDGLDVHLHMCHGTIYEEILKAAKTVGADLIVIASHRPELKDYLLGPNAARVVRHADCSVFVVRE